MLFLDRSRRRRRMGSRPDQLHSCGETNPNASLVTDGTPGPH
jgi:hypothetical protein